jgi:glycosyltransferase involved in cell wall biosynthesis
MVLSPAVSVVVPFFNSERHIALCADALKSQVGVDGTFELIFINNRSADASASIVEKTAGVVLLHEDTPGAYAARNTGIKNAKAPLIAFTDADCVVDSDWLRSILDSMKDSSVAIVAGFLRYPPQASLALRMLGAYENAKVEYVLNHCEPAQHFAYTNNLAVRASVFEELGLFKEWKRAADTELVHRLASQRPDLCVAYNRAMRVTHLEFLGARARAQRLRLYRSTNSKIDSFQELGLLDRLAVLKYLFRRDVGR